MKKIILILLMILFIPLGLLSYVYITPESYLSKTIIKSFSLEQRKNISSLINNTIFIIPNLNKRLKIAEYEINNINNNIFFLHNSINNNILNDTNNFQEITLSNFYSKEIYNKEKIKIGLKKYALPIFLNSGKKPRGYLEIFQDKIFLMRGDGEIYLLDTIKNNKKNQQPKILKIKTNLKDIISDINFFDNFNNKKYGQFIGVRDLLIYKNELYFSFLRESKNECYTISILKAEINYNFLDFKDFFFESDCVQTNVKSSGFGNGWGLLHSGGRMVIYNDVKEKKDKILLTTGELQNRTLAQDKSSIFGKVLSIDIKSKNFEIYSSGFRNSQGLLFIKEKNVIISTEHGPLGGDEINIIKKNHNYGWPISSYGEHYPGSYNSISPTELNKIAPLNSSHKDFGFEEPVHYFISAIAPSEIVQINKNFINSNDNLFFLTSLKSGSIFILKFNKNFSKVTFLEQIKINERIRDIIYDIKNNKYLMVFENSGSLGVLYNNDAPYNICLDNFEKLEYNKNVDLINYKMLNSFEKYCKNEHISKNTNPNLNIENLINDSPIALN